ncbi:hypothetical protein AVEN_265515-1 [Araneus ventricosus]|uniref:Uncharacterized protein n=1 Tax=Araneus ventricosus TaxID=182803 RepID=A0A4Y2LCX2_ARAVE|nr:hypothetical protein AVEN_265515-1 [Araneus ventricosus]
MMQLEPREISIPRRGAENRAYLTLNQKRYPEQNPKFSINLNMLWLWKATLIDIRIGDIHGRVCADPSATRSIAGELMSNLFRERGVDFQKMEVTISLADVSRTTT